MPPSSARIPARSERLSAWRALPTLLRIGFAESIAYRGEVILWMLTMTMPLVSLALWSVVAADGPVGGYSQTQFADYFLVILAVRMGTGTWVTWSISSEVREGHLSMRLLRPLHPLASYAVEMLGAIPLRILCAVPPAAVALFVVASDGVRYATPCIALVLALIGVWCLTFTISAAIGALALFMGSAIGPFMVWQGLFAIFSGYLVPTKLFPGWLSTLADWLPFRYALGFAAEAVLGRLAPGELWRGLLLQWGYVVVMTILTLFLFRRGVRRYEAYGS
ncbi:MAG: ABC-2 family transporter protein [Myxococcales bacterium]|nr:ABC-2 family transporter protein [Myxococcales bacterium]